MSRVTYHTYDAARRRAGLISRADQGRIVVAGRDRASYLNGLFTNDIVSLRSGQGCHAAYLTPQGRMIADARVYELGDVILLTLNRDVKDAVLAKLDQFVFSEDVQLGDVSESFAAIALVGPESASMAAPLLGVAPADLQRLPLHGNLRATFGDQPAIVLRVSDLGEKGFDLLAEGGQGAALHDALLAAGAVDVDAASADALRIEAGVPKFHRDMDETTIPLEAGLEATAISQAKGCYVGQEVIIRVLHRGHGRVARKLVGLSLSDGEPPAAGSAVLADGKAVGEITSAAWSPALKHPIALAYLHRDFLVPGTPVSVGDRPAAVTALPFIQR